MGDIAIIRTSTSIQNYLQEIAYTIMDAHKKVKAVLAQTGGVSSNFRLRQLNFIAGENRTVTFSHRMWVLVSVDVRRCFFRLDSHTKECELPGRSAMEKQSLICSQA